MQPLRWLTSLLRTQQQPPPKTESFYGLDHAVLNLPIPPPSMWMNLGYWKDTTDFPTACAALLDQVLITAGLLDSDDGGGGGGPLPHPANKSFRMLDVGIGCGDQALRILGYKREMPMGGGGGDGGGNGLRPLFDEYVGITSLPVQAEFAARRVAKLQEEADEKSSAQAAKTRAGIFCADAAKPASWSKDIHASLEPFRTKPHQEHATDPEKENQELESEEQPESLTETYFLALDTLYHFSPSRVPLLKYTKTTLNANFLAFDLLLPRTPLPLITRLLLRLLCLITGTPYSNFLTESEYISLLVEAGYDESQIEIRDISEHVFSGIARFMKRRVAEAKMFGVGGAGKYKASAVVFNWWATGVVRGVVVVARV
ncbi:hypothetical protein BJY01DRAFT_258748 [Aspergillus pseudoustus]|uniref:S-adenosyl-L-methionine-dependent methyltransferase n=1 Tax=Aspergillus pseudoustus TaxID=1810923 RepID=A0ABR4J867_9EURO